VFRFEKSPVSSLEELLGPIEEPRASSLASSGIGDGNEDSESSFGQIRVGIGGSGGSGGGSFGVGGQLDEDSTDTQSYGGWLQLTHLKLNETLLHSTDQSLRSVWRTRVIEMRHNKLKTVDMFQDCTSLEHLDLSFNEITQVRTIHLVLGNVRKLALANNSLESTEGLDSLYALEELDLSNNLLKAMLEIRRVAALPLLETLWTLGNPVCEGLRGYRRLVLEAFAEDGTNRSVGLPVLDGKRATKSEITGMFCVQAAVR
jgi:hypothetical protein